MTIVVQNSEMDDWDRTDAPVHPAVAAAQKKLRAYARDDRLPLFLDLHNLSFADDSAYVYTPPFEQMDAPTRSAFRRFIAMSAEYIQNPIPFTPDPREMGPEYDDRRLRLTPQASCTVKIAGE